MPGLADVKLGRLSFMTLLGADSQKETVGDPLDVDGAIVGAGNPRARAFAPKLPIRASISDTNSGNIAKRMRRQIRALMENDIARLQGTYFSWTVDPELNGWLLLGAADITPGPGAGITMADWQLELSDAYLVGQLRTHRPARTLRLWDRRLSTTPRDFLGNVYSTDFASQTALALHFLPVTVSDALGTGNAVLTQFVRNTLEGVIGGIAGQADSQTASYEQAETDLNKADVVILDRKTFTAPAYTSAGDLAPQDTYGWEEIYGPNQPLTAADVPVIQNGLCRLRYDAANTPGFKVDVYDAATSKYVEQGKFYVERRKTVGGFNQFTVNTLVSAAVVEWTPERGVLMVVMKASTATDASRERIYITLQRGWTGPRIEIYPAAQSDGSKAGVGLIYSVAGADTNDSALKIDAASVGFAATAGSGSALFSFAQLGAATFTGENHVVLAREGQTFAAVLALLQSGYTTNTFSSAAAYGATRNSVYVFAEQLGYLSIQFGFYAQTSDQIMEAEAIRWVSGTTSQVADAAASGGQCVRDTQVGAAALTVFKAGVVRAAKYRILAKVRTNGGSGNFRPDVQGVSSGATVTGTWATFTWIDLGELTFAAGQGVDIVGWRGTATSIDIDRVEMFKVEDRTAAAPAYDGGRDLGAAVLYDARQIPELVARG